MVVCVQGSQCASQEKAWLEREQQAATAAAAALRRQLSESGAKQAALEEERRLQTEELERMRQAAEVSKHERDAAMAQLAERMRAEHDEAMQLAERQLRLKMAAQEEQRRLELEKSAGALNMAVAERQLQIEQLTQKLDACKVEHQSTL